MIEKTQGYMEQIKITSEIVAAYTQCKLKAYLLFFGKKGTPHEYVSILEEETNKNREIYLSSTKMKIQGATPYSLEEMKAGTSTLRDANFTFCDFGAYADVLTGIKKNPSQIKQAYIPTIVIGTHKISKHQKVLLGFSGYVLSKLQNEKVLLGIIIGKGNISHTIKLEPLYKEIESSIINMRKWSDSPTSESPSVILNNHCQLCQFFEACETKCIELDDLSLLNKISTKKQIEKFERKGIFTVNQLSYLYRPRRQRKRSRKPPSIQHSIELQALVLRIGKIYLHSPPEILRNKTELFLDIEGIPDGQSFYLIGLLVYEENNSKYLSFWANDTTNDERHIWQQLVSALENYPDSPIYHYGSYDAKAIAAFGKRYKTETKEILSRLVNVNNFICTKPLTR